MEVTEPMGTLRAEVLDMQRAKAGKRVHYPLSIKEQVRGLRGAGWSVKRLAQELQLREELVRSWCQSPQADSPQVFAVRQQTGPAAAAAALRPPEAVQLRVGALTVTIEMARA